MKAGLGGPIVQLLLVVAAIALAVLVITMLTPPPPQPTLPQNPEIRILGTGSNAEGVITFVIKNPATERITITQIDIETDNGVLTLELSNGGNITVSGATGINAGYSIVGSSTATNIVQGGDTVTYKIEINGTGVDQLWGYKDRYDITIYTSNGVIHATAVFKG